MSTPPAIHQFHSPSTPDRTITYVHLNPGARHILLYCYGAGHTSLILNFYSKFLASHPDLSLLCIDRWTQGPSAARTGPALLSDLSAITLELLDLLKIEQFSIACHSAGVYQMFDLARHAPMRVGHVFPISSHIPVSYTGSKMMEAMCSMPGFMFRGITRLDSSLGESRVGKVLVGLMAKTTDGEGNKEEEVLVVSQADRKRVAQRIEEDSIQNKDRAEARAEQLNLDYRLGYRRIEGIDEDVLAGLYRDCSVDVTWYTSDGDVFFGPKSVERIIKEMNKVRSKQLVEVPEATHADIYLRTRVWEGMHATITGSSGA